MMKSTVAIVLLIVLAVACGSASAPSPAEDGALKGAQLFKMHCELCHGANGKLGFNEAKDLTASALTRAQMIAQVTNGKGKMMPYKNVLTAKEIEAVVDYTRTLGKTK
ncbi:MAG TPA: c-type cytochrome [Flavobacteriales bacterium]|nr:c-type cytochrome [Flavobacteriales bacterium]